MTVSNKLSAALALPAFHNDIKIKLLEEVERLLWVSKENEDLRAVLHDYIDLLEETEQEQ